MGPDGFPRGLSVMAAAMLRQQGAMREVLVWESEWRGVMREMSRLVDGAEPDM